MKSRPLVSVVMPVRNGARFLAEALASVEAQTYCDWELLVVGASSEDDSERIARERPSVRYLEQRGSGLWNAFNQGIAAARGDLLAFLSADDCWLPEKLHLQVEEMRRRPDLGVLGGGVRFVPVEGDLVSPSFRAELFEGEHPGYFPEVLMVRPGVFERIGSFDESYTLGADVEWLMRARARRIEADVVPSLLLLKRVHARNLSTLPSSSRLFQRDVLRIARARVMSRQV